MKQIRIIAEVVQTGPGDDPDWTLLVVTDKREGETVEVVMETAKAPLVAASLLRSGQDAGRRMRPEKLEEGWRWHVDSAKQILPEAVDMALSPDGSELRIDVGIGLFCFRLSETARTKIMRALGQG